MITVINVIGLGYIGLPTALMLASHGAQVVGTDINRETVERLNAGKTTFREAGLDELFAAAVKNGIRFSTEYCKTETYIVSVPTPYDTETKKVDPSYVVTAVKQVLRIAPKGAVVIIESTVSPGTIDRYVRPLLSECGFGADELHLVHAPERILPGNMLYELEHNSRTIGADDLKIGERVKELYGTFCKGTIVLTDIPTAEMTKVIENTYRAVNIAFANELMMLCRHEGMDVNEIIRICNMHPRVNILSPGPGVGGHCIPIDPWFLVGDFGEQTPLVRTALKINDGMPEYVFSRITEVMQENGISDYSRVGLYGLTYKENVDDVRESPTLRLLAAHPVGFRVYDPMVRKPIAEHQFFRFEDFCAACDMIVVMVGHDEIKADDRWQADQVVLDTRNVCKGAHIYRL